MALDPKNYKGREQAYVKHYFLAEYLERLIHKIASAYSEVVYVDGFSGPWQDQGEQFEDTSFGIALRALTRAKKTWETMQSPTLQRRVQMTAHLVEKDPTAFTKLSALQGLFPDVRIVLHNEDFVSIAPNIAKDLPPQAFAFVLIDPKGWNVDLRAIAPLIARDKCEVVFTFMFDFINRFALFNDPNISPQLDRLIPGRDWRSRVRTIDAREKTGTLAGNRASETRKGVLVEEFRKALADIGHYRFVADVDVLRPTENRTLYFLVYGTRQPQGIKVFRDCHVKSLKQQSDIRGRSKLEAREKRRGQRELLTSMHEMGPDQGMVSLSNEEQRAGQMLRDLVQESGRDVRWGAIWPLVLTKCVIRLTDLNGIANEYRKAGILEFPNWPEGTTRAPKDDYLVRRGRAETV